MIDLTTFFSNLGITGGATLSNNQYEFYKGVQWNDNDITNTQYEFFKKASGSRYEFFKAYGNERAFYEGGFNDVRIVDFKTFYEYAGEYLGGGVVPSLDLNLLFLINSTGVYYTSDAISFTASALPDAPIFGQPQAPLYLRKSQTILITPNRTSGGNTILYTSDWINSPGTWNTITLPFQVQDGTSGAYSEELDMLVFHKLDGTQICYSTDNGATWGTASLPTSHGSATSYHMAWSGTIFLLVSSFNFGAPSKISKSTDGVNWTYVGDGPTGRFFNLQYADGRFLMVADLFTNPKQYYSTDGESWTGATDPDNNINWYDASYSPALDRWVMVAYTAGTSSIAYSNDSGSNWTIANAPIGGLRAVAWSENANLFLAGRYDSGVGEMLLSYDGIDWIYATGSNLGSINHGITWC